MCFTNPICIFFIFFGVIISDCQLPKFTDKRIKLHKIAYKMTKNCLRGWRRWGGGGKSRVRRDNWGEERHGCWGIDDPVHARLPKRFHSFAFKLLKWLTVGVFNWHVIIITWLQLIAMAIKYKPFCLFCVWCVVVWTAVVTTPAREFFF